MRGPDSLGRGWWRRNVWGLVAVVPALALMVYAGVYSDLEYWQRGRPVQAPSAADGSAEFAGLRLRLVELAPTTELKRSATAAFVPPEGVTVWRAVIEIESPDPEKSPGCTIVLEDRAGNRHDTEAQELTKARVPLANCRPDTDSGGPAPVSGRYRTVAHFALATGVDAVAVRLSFGSFDLAVRYVRLSLPR